MFDDITRFAALVSSSLTKVDKNTLSPTSTGPANKIDVRNFVTPVQESPPSNPPVVTSSAPPPPPPQAPAPITPVSPPATVVQQPMLTKVVDQDSTQLVVEQLTRIADELGKINKKLTSVQKYCNENLNKQAPNDNNQ